MLFLDVIDPSRINRIADKTARLLSSANYKELGYTVSHTELRLYRKRDAGKGIYSIVTVFVETDLGAIEWILNEGYLGPNALEEEMSYVTSHLVLSNLILKSVTKLDVALRNPGMTVVEDRVRLLISTMRAGGFLSDGRVEDAIRSTPRHLFVPEDFVELAYEDRPLPTKKMQTISQPSVVAKMTELLDVGRGNKILEVGCGSGWQSAILSKLVQDQTVYSIERIQEIVEFARSNHKKAGIENVQVFLGDGTLGLPEQSPFDRIIITAGCRQVPPPLVEQLSQLGLLVAPVGEYYEQDLVVMQKTQDGIREIKRSPDVIFAPLIGRYGYPA